MRVRHRVTPPPNLTQQKGGSAGKAGANGSSQRTTLEKLRRFQAAAKSKRAGKYSRSAGVPGEDEEMSDFDAALVGAYERLDPDAQGQNSGQQPGHEEEDGEKKQEALPKFLPANARRI